METDRDTIIEKLASLRSNVASVESAVIDLSGRDRTQIQRLQAEIERLRAVLSLVEWVAEDPYIWCPWCHGMMPEREPERFPNDTDEVYDKWHREWVEYSKTSGHKSNCPRQAALKGGE